MKKSMIESAYQVLSEKNQAVPFLNLWQEVVKLMGFTPSQADDNIAQFYSDLSMDGRFTNLKGNNWDLRKRQSSATVLVDTDKISVEDEEDNVPEFEEEDEVTTESEE